MSLKPWERRLLKRLASNPLAFGDQDGSEIRRWRARLRRKGFVVDQHGPFDQRLWNATRAAQSWAGVSIDGIVGPATWKAVGAKTRTKRPATALKHAAGLGRPKILDVRKGQHGFPRHASRRWGKRSRGALVAKLGHYTGGPASFVADARFHVSSDYLDAGGAPALAYTIGVDKDGTVFLFNDWDDVTWHCDGGKNTVTVGIVFRGGAEGPTLAQSKSLAWLWKALEDGTFGFGFPKMPVVSTTHRHVRATSCPGEKGEAFYRSISSSFRTAL